MASFSHYVSIIKVQIVITRLLERTSDAFAATWTDLEMVTLSK